MYRWASILTSIVFKKARSTISALYNASSVVFPIIILALSFQTFTAWYKIRHFEDPRLAAVSKLWVLERTYRHNLHIEVRRGCDEYGATHQGSTGCERLLLAFSHPLGSFVRIGPNDLDYVIKMSSVRSRYARSEAYAVTQFDLEINHVFSERNEARYLELRRQLAPEVQTELPFVPKIRF